MKLIVGLGNPGSRYAHTPHNLGFDVVDELARRWGMKFQPRARLKGELAEGRIGQTPVQLLKPLTYMNRSGESIGPLVRQSELGEEELLIVTDDVNLPIGRLRIRAEGSHGGHNGLRSVIERLGHSRFARLRIGVQPPWPVDDLVAFVLSKLPLEQRQQLATMTEAAADATEAWLREGTSATANDYNGRRWFED